MKKLFFFTLISFLAFLNSCKKEDNYIAYIGTLGDSITKGTSDANYPREMAMMISDAYKINNYGVAEACLVKDCFRPIWEEDQFVKLFKDRPDIITVMLGTNDCHMFNSDTVRANFEKDYREMIGFLQGLSSRPRILLCYPPPIYALSTRADSLIRTEIIPIIDKIAEDYQIEVVDTYYQVNDYPENYADGLHPDREGAVTLAQIIVDKLDL